MSTVATQAVLAEFCTQHGLTVALGFIGAILTHEQIQSFLGFLRLIPTVPADRLDELERNLQLRVRDMQIADLTAENERLREANRALEVRITALQARPAAPPASRPMPAPRVRGTIRPPDRRPSMLPLRLSPESEKATPAPKRGRAAAGGAMPPMRKRIRAAPKPAPPPAPATPSDAGSATEERKKDDDPPCDKSAGGLVSTSADLL
jgi:hypothetical protein